jgi:serine/threonine protein kinase
MNDVCPPVDRLARMLEDLLTGPEADDVESHVSSCTDCQQVLEDLTRQGPDDWAAPDDDSGRVVGLIHDARPRAARPAFPGYEIERELGRGGMGVVYLARQVNADRLVAVKSVLAPDLLRPEELVRFRLEGESLARLDHPNIVKVHEVGVYAGQPFFSMEYVAGGTLSLALEKSPRSARQSAEMVEVLARAVHGAHLQGVVHRDLKPANILLTSEGLPKVTDFGLASESATTAAGRKAARLWARPATWHRSRPVAKRPLASRPTSTHSEPFSTRCSPRGRRSRERPTGRR